MKPDHGRWPFSMVWLDGPTFMVRFLQFSSTKPLGPLLGVNRMWTKRNDHAPKNECAHYFNIICAKRAILKKIKFDHSLVFIFSSPQKSFLIVYIINIISFAMGTCLFQLEHLFCLSHHKTCWSMSVDTISLKICLLETLNFMITLTFFPWCKPKWSQDEFNNQSQSLHCLETISWSIMM